MEAGIDDIRRIADELRALMEKYGAAIKDDDTGYSVSLMVHTPFLVGTPSSGLMVTASLYIARPKDTGTIATHKGAR